MRRRKLADDVHVAAEQKIEMFGDGTGQRILNRDHRTVNRFALHAIEDLERTRTWNHHRSRAKSLPPLHD